MLRKLNENDLKEFNFIAKIHESLPGAWIDNYTIDDEEVKITLKGLVEKHKTNDILCYIAEKDSKIISFIWAEINKSNLETVDIISLWTDEEYRGQGIASSLKIELEKWAKLETSAKSISTTVSAKNKSMINLNRKLGYEIMSYKMIKKI